MAFFLIGDSATRLPPKRPGDAMNDILLGTSPTVRNLRFNDNVF
jgi:hypothetical protein